MGTARAASAAVPGGPLVLETEDAAASAGVDAATEGGGSDADGE
jgi:hypothetical protein